MKKRVRNLVLDKTDGRCWYCGVHLRPRKEVSSDKSIKKNVFVCDHIVSRKNGGTDDIKNLVPSCWSCNASKRHKSVDEFRFLVARQHAGIPYFSEEQLAWLESKGFDPYADIDNVTFWGERQQA